MAKRLFIKPAAEGLLVRDPLTRNPLAAEGEDKPDSQHWRRRLRFGEVVETKRPKPEKRSSGKES